MCDFLPMRYCPAAARLRVASRSNLALDARLMLAADAAAMGRVLLRRWLEIAERRTNWQTTSWNYGLQAEDYQLSRMFDLPLLLGAWADDRLLYLRASARDARHAFAPLHDASRRRVHHRSASSSGACAMCCFGCCRFPSSRWRCAHEWLPPRKGREPISNAVALFALVRKSPPGCCNRVLASGCTESSAI